MIGIGWHSRRRKDEERLEAEEKARQEAENEGPTTIVQGTVFGMLEMLMNQMHGVTADEVNSEII